MLEENEEIRKARLDEIREMPKDAREAALEELEAYLAGRVPEQLASRVQVHAPLAHVWSCFWDLDSTRPISSMQVGMGASVPVRQDLPWDRVSMWLDERGIQDEQERHVIRGLLRSMDAVYREHQSALLNGALAAAEEERDDG